MKIKKSVESVPLLSLGRSAHHSLFKTRKSKAVLLIMLGNFSILLIYKGLYDISNYMQVNKYGQVFPFIYLSFSLITIFSPVAGVLTDVKFSRYKAVLCSSCSSLVTLIVISIFAAIYRILHFHALHSELLYIVSSCFSAIPIVLL